MLFQHTWEKVLSGEKTQTRRIAMPDADGTGEFDCEMIGYPMGNMAVQRLKAGADKWRTIYQVGKDYAVQRKRGERTLWYRCTDGWFWEYEPFDLKTFHGNGFEAGLNPKTTAENLKSHGWNEVRIRITDIRREDVREIDYCDVLAEGFRHENEFLYVWCSMHDPKGYSEYFKHSAPEPRQPAAFLKSRPDNFYQAWALSFCLVER